MLNETLRHQSLQLLLRRPRIFLIWQAVPGTNGAPAHMLFRVEKIIHEKMIWGHAFPFDYPEVSGCLFCCLSCPVCVEAMHLCSAMPCVPELLGGSLSPLPADKSD